MPYIKEEKRPYIDAGGIPEDAGELNYALCRVLLAYLSRKGLKYQTINDIVGALESCKAEFQRRVVGPYEDIKIRENGDL